MHKLNSWKQLLLAFSLLCFFGLTNVSGQTKRLNNWVFGDKTMLDFNTGTPVTVAGSQMNTREGCSSISTKEGQLLFYTDGTTVWDSTHALMPQADGTDWNKKLSGGSSSAQAAIITTFPCDTDRYYIFTCDGSTTFGFDDPKGKMDGLYYTVINTTLNNGKGDVDIAYLSTQPGYTAGANKILLTDSVQEKTNVAIHANGIDQWVITQRYDGSLYAYHVSCNGIDMTPVVTPQVYGGSILAFATPGVMAVSRDGKCIVITGGPAPNWPVDVFDFDNATGQVSNKREIISTLSDLDGIAWGACFSPNDSIIYVCAWQGDKAKRFLRYAPTIKASGVKMNLPTSTTVMQQAPDGLIYLNNFTNPTYLSAFTDPNNFANPNFVSNQVPLFPIGGKGNDGLPHSYTGFYHTPKMEFARNDTAVCEGETTTLQLGKSAEALDCFEYHWEPEEGLDDPYSPSPTVVVTDSVTYKVFVSAACTTFVDSVTIDVFSCELPAIYFPNAITLNNDGLNEKFFPKYNNYVYNDYELLIYNRWGELLFRSNDIDTGWDGYYQGRKVEQGVYVYKVRLVSTEGETIENVGRLTVLR